MISLRGQTVRTGRTNPPKSVGYPPAMYINRENLSPKRIHHHAPSHFLANARQADKIPLAFVVFHFVKGRKRRLAEPGNCHSQDGLDGTCLFSRQTPSRDRAGNLRYRGRCKLSVCGESPPQRPKRLSITRLGCFRAA